MLVQVVGGGHRNDFTDFLPPAFVNSQIAQVNGPKIFERMVSGSSPLSKSLLLHFFFFFKFGTKKILSSRRVKDFFELARIVISRRAGHKGFPYTKWATNKKFRQLDSSWRIENAVDGETSSNQTFCLSLTSCLGNPCVLPFMKIPSLSGVK